MGKNRDTSEKNRKNINFNELQEDLKRGKDVNKVSIVWNGDMPKLLGPKKKSQNANDAAKETASEGNTENGLVKNFKGFILEKKQALEGKNLNDRFNKIVEVLKAREEPLLFWSRAHIDDIFEKVKTPDMKYWKEKQNMIEGVCVTKNGISTDLDGEASSYVVAIDKRMITINMITGALDGNNSVDWSMMSRAFAMGAKDVAFFLTEAKNEDELGKVWKSIERKALIDNRSVGLIVELDLVNPEKINSVIIKGGLTNAEKYGFKLPSEYSRLKNNPEFKETFKLKFEVEGIKHVQLDENGAEKENTVINLNGLLGKTNRYQRENADKMKKNTNGDDEYDFGIGM